MFIVRNTFYKDFNYLALSIYIAWSLFSYVFTIGMMTRFYLKMRKQNVSSMLRIYQFVWIYLCIAATTCFGFRSLDVYEITDFISRHLIFDLTVGCSHISSVFLMPIASCLLIIDRILAIKSTKYLKYQYYMHYFNIFILISVYLTFFTITFYKCLHPVRTLVDVEMQYCGFSCRIYLNISDLHLFKSCMGLANFCLGIYFAYLFFKRFRFSSRDKKNLTVLCIIGTELLFNLIPSIVFTYIQTNDAIIFNFRPGDIILIASSLDAFLTSLSYCCTYQKSNKIGSSYNTYNNSQPKMSKF